MTITKSWHLDASPIAFMESTITYVDEIIHDRQQHGMAAILFDVIANTTYAASHALALTTIAITDRTVILEAIATPA